MYNSKTENHLNLRLNRSPDQINKLRNFKFHPSALLILKSGCASGSIGKNEFKFQKVITFSSCGLMALST